MIPKRLVIFNPFHFPVVNPRSIRIQNLLNVLASRYNYIFITNPGEDVGLVLDNRIKFHGTQITSASFRNRLAYKLLSNCVKKIVWPDIFIFNSIYHFFIYLLKYRKTEDILLTISNPVSVHFIGIFSRIFFSKKALWIADIGDAMVKSYEPSWWNYLSLKMEEWVINHADHIIFNSEFLANYYDTKFPGLKTKSKVISNGPYLDFKDIKSVFSSQVVFSYFGNTYLPVRPAKREIEIIERIQNMIQNEDLNSIFNIIGVHYEELVDFTRGISGIKIFPQQIGEELVMAYRRTNILVSFANVNYDVVPSKLEEYCSTGLPIICFCNDMEDASVRYLGNYPTKFIFQIGISKEEDLQNFVIMHRFDGIQSNTLIHDSHRLRWQKYLDELNI